MHLPPHPFRSVLAAAVLLTTAASTSAYQQVPHGIAVESGDETIRLEVFSDTIIRVTAGPTGVASKTVSYAVVEPNRTPVEWEVREADGLVKLVTPRLEVQVDRENGQVRFLDAHGELLLQEVAGGRTLTPAVVMEEATFHVQQRYELGSVRAIHGLGAHQNGIANYRGRDALLKQYNTVDINTFFLTDRGWGLLWDNNSITRFGDPRPYQDLDTLELRDKSGAPGGLTATYYRASDFTDELVSRTERAIDYTFIPDKEKVPEGFDMETGSIVWEGSIEAREAGRHKFELYSSSYTRLWIGDEQLAERWRVNWMPWTDHFEIELNPGEPQKIRLEWNANAGYAALKVLPPEPPELDRQIVLTSEVGEAVDYYFVLGEDRQDPSSVIAGYRQLTGQAPLLPVWALGKFQSRERYKTQEELLGVVREYRARGLPLDVIVLDWNYWPEAGWGTHDMDLERFPDAAAMNHELHEAHNARIMVSVWPKFYVGTPYYEEMNRKGWLYRRNVESGDRDWIGEGYLSTFYDAFNPEAGAFFWEGLSEKLFSKGFDAWWLDATEPDMHSNITIEERKLRMHPTATGSGARNFNAYSINNARAVYEGQRREAPDQRVFILTRSAFAGQQRYAAASWSGDVSARWEDFDKQVAAGINFSAAGIPWWTTDIGGFAVEPRFEQPDAAALEEWRELNMRWYQFGAFTPLFRSHGQFPFREPWHIAPGGHPVYEAMARYNRLRYRLMPWLYSLAGAVTHHSAIVMRPLTLEFPDDERAFDINDQFMHGPAFLVCPVIRYGQRERSVYLPAGTDWYDFHSGARLPGGQTLTAQAPLTDLPLYVRAGSLLLLGPDIEYTGQKPADPIEIRVFPGADGQFELYEDEGTNYSYEEGAFSRIPLTWDDATRTLTVGARVGEFPGMLQQRTFRIVDGSASGVPAFGLAEEAGKTVTYTGTPIEISL